MQKNSGQLVLQPKLTEIGKKRLLENRFDITKIAVADDGVNYKLINENIIDPELAVKRTPVLSAWKDSSFNMNNKIIVDGKATYISEKDFDPSINILGDLMTVRPKGMGSEINFPRVLSEEDTVTVQYFITNNDISKEKVDLQFAFNSKMIDGDDSSGERDRPINIRTSERQGGNMISGMSRPIRTSNRQRGDFLVATLSESKYFDVYISEDNVNRSIMETKNFQDAFTVSDERERFPKVVNVYLGSNNSPDNSFYLHYKGNFRYDQIDTERYETTLTLMEESTGRFQKIKIQIIPTSQQTENE